MKIFDCFTFFNERELLQIRLEELYDIVDHFVLVECTIKHSGEPKPLYYSDNKRKFEKWSKKIIHIIVDDAPLPGFSLTTFKNLDARWGFGRWKTERYQRNQIHRGLINSSKDDIIIISDIDEIPNRLRFAEMKEKINDYGYVAFNQKMYYYYLNGFVDNTNWRGSIACNYQTFNDIFSGKADRVRRLNNAKIRLLNKLSIRKHPTLDFGGWHFSYLGGTKKVIEKMKSTPHSEHKKHESFYTENNIASLIKNGVDIYARKNKSITYVQIDNSFPTTIINNINKYRLLIMKRDNAR